MLDKEDEQTIEEINQKIKELQGKVNELKSGNKITRWRAKITKFFYYVRNDGTIELHQEQPPYRIEDYCYSIGNYFKTEEEAKKYYKHLIITQKLKDIALRLNNGEEIDYNTYFGIDVQKYKIILKPNNNELLQAISTQQIDLGQIYCLSDKFLETAIEEIGEQELINYIKEN